MSRFGADSHEFFSRVYDVVPPWDIGAAQPDMAALLQEFSPTGPVLDVGCGSGDLAIHIAQLGLDVTGVDFVETAVAHARKKAAALPPGVASRLEFRVADAARPSLLGRKFGSVVDSGFLHVLSPDETDRFVDDVAASLQPGGLYFIHEFATEFPVPNTPRQITEDEVRRRFTIGRGWRIHALRPARFLNRVADPVPAVAACIERCVS